MEDKKIQFTPPTTQIFKGQPPPTSWLTQNIIPYLQIKQQATVLQDLINYAQELKEKPTVKTKKIPETHLKPFPFPEKGTKEEMANNILLNASQPLIKTELESLEKLLNLLKQGNPKLAKELDQNFEDLSAIAKDFPKLMPHQLKHLTKLIGKFENLADKLPLPLKTKFLTTELSMLKQMMETTEKEVNEFKKDGAEVSKHKLTAEELRKLLIVLSFILNKMKLEGKLSQNQVTTFLLSVTTLGNHGSSLNPKQVELIRDLLRFFLEVKTKNGKSLCNFYCESLIHDQMVEFLKNNPHATPKQLKQFLKAFLEKTGLSKTTLPFLKEAGKHFEDLIEDSQFPFMAAQGGVFFAFGKEDRIQLNKNFLDELANAVTFNPNTLDFKQSFETADGQLEEWIGIDTKMEAGLKKSGATLDAQKENLGKAAATTFMKLAASGKMGSTESLPDQFKHSILDHYMPQQEEFLMEMAALMYFDNMGAEMGNMLLGSLSDFAGAQFNYNFSGMLGQKSGTPPQFSGSYSAAKNALSKEQNQVSTDINNANNALNQISQEIAKIKNDPTLSQSQKDELIGKLQKYSANLKVALKQLQNLKSILSNMQVTKGSTDGKFNITATAGHTLPADWQQQLSQGENSVINGDNKSDPKGGLLNINTMITTDQSHYSKEGETQQMKLQLTMTEVQQEWTVVSTALQLLNQMYMTVAQGIYK